MSRLEDIAARLDAALKALEAAALPLAEARARAARDAAEIAGLNAERESLLARIAELEDETRSLAGITEEVESRLDGAIEEIRSALGEISMPLVNVMVNSRAYTIACDDGEEDHLRELAAHVDTKVRELLESVGQVGDQRLLLMAAVLITDELFEARARQDAHAKKAGDLASAHSEISGKLSQSETLARESLEAAAKRVESLTAKLNAA